MSDMKDFTCLQYNLIIYNTWQLIQARKCSSFIKLFSLKNEDFVIM